MEKDNNKVTMEERTDRTLTIKFYGDIEYLNFVKIMANSTYIQKLPPLKVFFEEQFEKIFSDDELNELYGQIK